VAFFAGTLALLLAKTAFKLASLVAEALGLGTGAPGVFAGVL
jgi:hypothetical protein